MEQQEESLNVQDRTENKNQEKLSELIFFGTGASSKVPITSCIANRNTVGCKVCEDALLPNSKNRRNNTSLLIHYTQTPSNTPRNILIDVGKSLYHSSLPLVEKYSQIKRIDAVVLTHTHDDAVGGLGDLREFMTHVVEDPPVDVYLRKKDLEQLAQTYAFLVDTNKVSKSSFTAKFQFHVIEEYVPFEVCGLTMVPIPVWHGENYVALGFRFANVCYISDVSGLPLRSKPYLSNLDLLICDGLAWDIPHPAHWNISTALYEARNVKPGKVLLTGIGHTVHHDWINEELHQLKISEHLDMQLAYDSELVHVDLSKQMKITESNYYSPDRQNLMVIGLEERKDLVTSLLLHLILKTEKYHKTALVNFRPSNFSTPQNYIPNPAENGEPEPNFFTLLDEKIALLSSVDQLMAFSESYNNKIQGAFLIDSKARSILGTEADFENIEQMVHALEGLSFVYLCILSTGIDWLHFFKKLRALSKHQAFLGRLNLSTGEQDSWRLQHIIQFDNQEWKDQFFSVMGVLPPIISTVEENHIDEPVENIIKDERNIWMYFLDARKLGILKTEDLTGGFRFVPPP